MVQANNSISRRTVFCSALAAGASLAIPAAALAQAETLNDKDTETLQRPLAILGKALVNNQIDCKFSKPKKGISHSVFTIRLKDGEDMEFMGAMLAGTVFAGIYTADEIITKLEKNRDSKAA
jgi:hypothetical protein